MRHRPIRFASFAPLAVAALWLAGSEARAATPAAESGERLYERWCVHCHGAGRGNPGTQSLQVKYGGRLPAVLLERTDLAPAAVAQVVRQGMLSMAPYRKTEITDAELAVLAAYVARNQGRQP